MTNKRITLFDPYYPSIRVANKYENLICVLLERQGIKLNKMDLLTVLNKTATPIKDDFGDLIPSNVKLAQFPQDLNPLVVLYKKPVVLVEKWYLGSSYWGNILAWRYLLGDRRALETLDDIQMWQRYFEDIKLLFESEIYVDAEDDFIKRILSAIGKNKLDENLSKMIFRYFKYLSFFPFSIGNICSCLIFLETLDSLERDIANVLNFEQPRPLLQRIGKIRDIYLQYLDDTNNIYEIRRTPADTCGDETE